MLSVDGVSQLVFKLLTFDAGVAGAGGTLETVAYPLLLAKAITEIYGWRAFSIFLLGHGHYPPLSINCNL